MEITPRQIAEEYYKAYPNELLNGEGKRMEIEEHAFKNWYERFLKEPESATSLSKDNWAGKVTAALLRLKGIKRPKNKTELLKVLQEN